MGASERLRSQIGLPEPWLAGMTWSTVLCQCGVNIPLPNAVGGLIVARDVSETEAKLHRNNDSRAIYKGLAVRLFLS